MKRIYTILVAVLLSLSVFAQAPQKMSYQSVVRDASSNLITNTQVGLQVRVLQGSAIGTEVYSETQTPTTNANGLLSVEIGGQTGFDTITWANGPYFIETSIDPAGGTNYTITGTSQLLSVPYALHAKTAESITGGVTETDPIFGSSVAGGITGTDTTNWNNKLDSYTETDPSVPTGTQTGDMQYWNGTAWVTVQAGNEGQVLTFTGGVPTWKTQLEDGDVENPTTGKIWMDRNLGASQVATSSTDANAYGDLYQWGRAADGHESRTSSTTSTLATSDTPGHANFITASNSPYDWRNPKNDNLWQGVNGTNNPCPIGYRLPTEAEWNAERLSWSSNNAAGAFASPLKLSVAGSRYYSYGTLFNVGSYGSYWSSTVYGSEASYLGFYSSSAYMGTLSRANGFSVRCLKD